MEAETRFVFVFLFIFILAFVLFTKVFCSVLGSKKSNLIDAFFKQTTKVEQSKTNSLISMGAVTKSKKYKLGSTMQADRYLRLLTMIIKCMLPISIVEQPGFRDLWSILTPASRCLLGKQLRIQVFVICTVLLPAK